MKKALFFTAAVSAILLFFACSSGGGESTVSCKLPSGTCRTDFTADQCFSAEGEVIQACPSNPSTGGGGVLACLIGGASCIPVLDNATCDLATGKIVPSCPGSDQFVLCEAMGTCSALMNSQQCTQSTGTVVTTCPGSGGNPGNNNSSNSGGGLPGGSNSSSSGNSGGGTSSNSGGGLPGTDPNIGKFCDCGSATSDTPNGGGCESITADKPCDPEYCVVVANANSCGDNIWYCLWKAGNCHRLDMDDDESVYDCLDWGTPTYKCPQSSLNCTHNVLTDTWTCPK